MLNLTRLLTCILLASSGLASAQEPIRFARTPDISPDGKLITFSYQGDIYTCETIGGTARAVTSHPAHDINPIFSPDGRQIAFSSNRHGSYDIFVVGARGGKPKRLTFDASSDMACGWSPDGKSITEDCIEINRLENVGDQIFRRLLTELFDSHTDAGTLLKHKDIYEVLEAATDRCEDAADVLQAIQVKNS